MDAGDDGHLALEIGDRAHDGNDEIELVERRHGQRERVDEKDRWRRRDEGHVAEGRARHLPGAIGVGHDELADEPVRGGHRRRGLLGRTGILLRRRSLAARGQGDDEGQNDADRAKVHGRRSLPRFDGAEGPAKECGEKPAY